MEKNKCPDCGDDIQLTAMEEDPYWIHLGDIDPNCFLRNVAE